MPSARPPRSLFFCLAILLILVAGSIAHGQSVLPPGPGLEVSGNRFTGNTVYRPSSADYRYWDGERFDLIYQAGTADAAQRIKRSLQNSWPQVDSLVGPVDDDFSTPVVVTGYTDRGGGRVRLFPTYQEIQATSAKAADLSHGTTWPQLVGSHELVHSAHMDVDGGVGAGGLVRPFAPDWARGLNGLYPNGATEGAAVYLESQLQEDAGRLHAPTFTMRMKAAMLSDDPWTLKQMLSAPVYSKPADRHYVGGAHAFQYLAERGDSTSTDFFHGAVTWQNRIPFLGLGPWLGVGADQFPHEITDEMQTQLRERYAAEQNRRRPFTDVTVVASNEGLYHRRPYWIDDTTLVAHVNGYDVREGLYTIDTETGTRSLVRHQTLARDKRYGLGRDTTALYTARYVRDALARGQEIAEVERVPLSSGDATQITQHGRAIAPTEDPNGTLHVVKNDGAFTQWGVVEGDSVRTLTPSNATSIRRVAPAPSADGPIAVLKDVTDQQQLYRARRSGTGPPSLTPWLRLDDARIYDVSWGPGGRYLLFTADYPQAVNVFAFDRQTQEVLQLATVPFGAREPVLSPDRSTVAFAHYQHERYDLVRMPFRPDSATVLPDSVVTLNGPAQDPPASSTPTMAANSSHSYQAWRHLEPDAMYPTLRDSPTEWGQYFGTGAEPLALGVEMTGADPLRQWAYRTSAYWEDGRVWGEARVESGHFLLRPSLSVYNRAVNPSDGDRAGLEERGVGVGIRLPVTLESNVYRTTLQFGLETKLRQTRKYGGGLNGLTPYSTRLTLNPRVGLRYRIQRNRRDLIPNTGLSIGVEGEYDPWMEDMRSAMDGRRKALRSEASVYLPFLRGSNTGLRLGAGLLTQNRSSFKTVAFVPRGYDGLPGSGDGTFLRLDGEIVQPLWYIENGSTLLPVYFGALSAYGFGQTLGQVDGSGWHDSKTSVGGGLGLSMKMFGLFGFKLRVGAAYRLGPGDVQPTLR